MFLIPDHETTSVPKGVARQELYRIGCIINFLEFNTTWKEDKVTEVIEQAFEKVLVQESTSPRYFVCACSESIT